jgi:hypothetical protein
MTDFFLVVLGATVLGYTNVTVESTSGGFYGMYTLSAMVVGLTAGESAT